MRVRERKRKREEERERQREKKRMRGGLWPVDAVAERWSDQMKERQ
jgi:hypothetical protein